MRTFKILLALAMLPALSACASLFYGDQHGTRSGSSSSLVDYLYPDGQIPPGVPDSLPYLELPVRVGIAFVPSNSRSTLSGAEQSVLLDQVASAFRDRRYVKSIETIPQQYLAGARGVVGMQQVAALYGIDVMALVSYDQVAFTGERDSAILYWTIVGTALVKGNTNEVQTMIDTAVFDVKTARLLFRAPGSDTDQRNATLIETGSDLRRLQSDSIRAANQAMITNLDAELATFEERVKQGEAAQVAWTGGGGGGSTGVVLVVLVAAALALRRRDPSVAGYRAAR